MWPHAKASGGQVTAGDSSRCAALADTAAVTGNPHNPNLALCAVDCVLWGFACSMQTWVLLQSAATTVSFVPLLLKMHAGCGGSAAAAVCLLAGAAEHPHCAAHVALQLQLHSPHSGGAGSIGATHRVARWGQVLLCVWTGLAQYACSNCAPYTCTRAAAAAHLGLCAAT